MSDPKTDMAVPGSRCIVVFSGDTDLAYLKMLKPRFRHCCALVEAGRYWVFYNPTSRGTEIAVFDGLSLEDIVRWFHDNRCVVYCGRIVTPPARSAPYRIFTCVEAVKRVIGVQAPGALTPWQLFRFLTAHQHIRQFHENIRKKSQHMNFLIDT